MPTRIITGTISSNASTDLAGGKFVGFTVSSDTGAAPTGAISAARLTLSAIRCYAQSAYLEVIFHSTTHSALAMTDVLSGENSIHSEDFTLEALSNTLVTGTPSTIYLQVVATSGSGNKINFRDNCTLTLEIDYTLPPSKCTPPSDVSVSSSTSTGENVTLSWSAGGDGVNNPASHYEIARMESADGITWGDLETVTTATGLSCSVPPPTTYGHYYRYFVRLVGTAGASYASEWVACSASLQNPPITKCAAPGGVKVSSTTSLGENVTLSWNAGAGGTHNAASYYEIARKESTDGKTWGSLTTYKDNAGNVTSYSVPPPSTPGNYYRYYVRLVGAAGTTYASDWAECSTSLQNPPITSCTAPSGVSVSSSTSHGENVALSWNAGAGGTHNAAGYYEIARKESADGNTWGDMVTVTTTTGLSCSVPPPTAYGHYYRYYVRLVGAAGTPYASAWVLCKNNLQKVRPALVAYTDEIIAAGTTRIKAAHILELRTNVDRLRQGLGLAAYSFTECRAGYTSLARWRAHVLELRAAIDEMAPTHETWIDIPVNRPTAAVMQQLRRVVAAI